MLAVPARGLPASEWEPFPGDPALEQVMLRIAKPAEGVRLPALLLADEPTGNLDSRSGEEVLSFLRRSVDRLGQTIVMVTHDPVAAGFTDRVVFLADGRVVDEMREPTSERVLDRMKAFDAAARR